MPQPMIATDMLGAIGRSKSGDHHNNADRCKRCDSTNIYEVEETEGKIKVTYKVCENCGTREKVKEQRVSILAELFHSRK